MSRLLLLNLWLKVMHRMLLLVLLRVLLRILLGILLGILLLLLLLRWLLLVVLGRNWTGVFCLTLMLLSIHRGLIAVVLGVYRDGRAENFDGAIMSSDCDHVLALRAAVLGIFEPSCETGHAGQADAEEAENGTNDTIIYRIST